MSFKKKGFQVSFSWLFAIIAGIFILFLAIYISVKVISNQSYEVDTTTAKEIEILLNPLETGFEEKSSTTMTTATDTRIYNHCYTFGNFGEQGLQVAQKSFGKWSDAGAEIKFQNKYIFSNEIIEGKNFYLFSQKFEYPFKVADLIILLSPEKEYCFLNAPEKVLDDSEVFPKNVKLIDCSSDAVRVCFDSGSNCDIKVNMFSETVEKNEEKLYFSDELLYAAIFSDEEIYECQVKRLMKRASELSELYLKKAVLVKQDGCDSNVDGELTQFADLTEDFESSENFRILERFMIELKDKNDLSICRLW